MKNKTWVWGYFLPEIPSETFFVKGKSYCSLETAAKYLEVPNVIFMNSNHDINSLDAKHLDNFKDCKKVICGLQHGNYAETALKVSRISRKYKNIHGAVIDDFLDFHGPSAKMTVDELKDVYKNLKSCNKNLKLYVVRYTWQNQSELIPYLKYFDAVNLWVWISTEHAWRSEYLPHLEQLKNITGKPVTQGLFLHNYGETWDISEEPVSMDMLQLQCKKVFPLLRDKALDGCVILQNGWFSHENHREQVVWLKNYMDWIAGTTTIRN